MKLAIFDFNGTLFPKETIPFLIKCWKKFGYSKFNLYKLYLRLAPLIMKYRYPFLTSMSIEEMKVEFMYRFVKIFKGLSEEEIEEYFAKVEKEASQYYNKSVLNHLKKCHKQGFEIVLLSGTFQELLNNVGNRLGAGCIIGSTILKDRKNNLDKFSVLSGSLKLKAVKNHYDTKDVDWEKSYAFADSIDDLTLLQAVGKPVAVEPDEYLFEVAKSESWKIINNHRG